MKIKYFLVWVVACLTATLSTVYAQTSPGQNLITPAVPFLRLAPDARSGGMGDAGVATSPDVNAVHFNPAKLAFLDTKFGGSLSYTPWLRKLVNDRFLANASAYYKANQRHVIAINFTYFALGDYLDISSMEYALGGAYAGKLSDKFSIGFGLKYIYSDMNAFSPPGFTIKPGKTVAGDISIFYTNGVYMLGEEVDFAFGASLTNLGGGISYADKSQRQYLPATLKFGPAFTYQLQEGSKLTLTMDVNKLLVPTINQIVPMNGSPVGAIFSSFTDAPGGFSEEMKEFFLASGAEYTFKDIVLLRGGYYWEHRDKGNNKYFTLGAGVRYKMAALDVSYLIGQQRQYILDDTMRFTLRLNVGEIN